MGGSLLAMSDQLLYSGSNFVLTIFVARESTVGDFGFFSLLLATYLICSAVNRGLISEPLTISHSGGSEDDRRRAGGRLRIAPAFVGVVCSALVGGLFLPFANGAMRDVVLVYMCGIPILFIQDYFRYCAFMMGRPELALANDGSVVGVQVAAFAASLVLLRQSPATFVACWVAASCVGAVVGNYVLGFGAPRLMRVSQISAGGLSRKLAVDNLVTQSAQQGSGYVVAAIAGLTAAAGLRAGQTVLTPPATLALGMQAALTPELVRIKRHSLTRMRSYIRRASIALSTTAAVYTVALAFLPPRLGFALIGASWTQAHRLVPLLGLAQVAGSFCNASIAGLRALADADRTLKARSLGLAASVIFVVPGTIVAGALGAAVGLASSSIMQAFTWNFLFRVSFREEQRRSTHDRIARDWADLLSSLPPDAGETPIF